MSDFFTFKRLITTSIIQVLYTIGAIVITITGISLIASSASGKDMWYVFGLLVLTVGNVGWRLSCEGLIMFSNMHDKLADLHDVLRDNLDALEDIQQTIEEGQEGDKNSDES